MFGSRESLQNSLELDKERVQREVYSLAIGTDNDSLSQNLQENFTPFTPALHPERGESPVLDLLPGVY